MAHDELAGIGIAAELTGKEGSIVVVRIIFHLHRVLSQAAQHLPQTLPVSVVLIQAGGRLRLPGGALFLCCPDNIFLPKRLLLQVGGAARIVGASTSAAAAQLLIGGRRVGEIGFGRWRRRPTAGRPRVPANNTAVGLPVAGGRRRWNFSRRRLAIALRGGVAGGGGGWGGGWAPQVAAHQAGLTATGAPRTGCDGSNTRHVGGWVMDGSGRGRVAQWGVGSISGGCSCRRWTAVVWWCSRSGAAHIGGINTLCLFRQVNRR